MVEVLVTGARITSSRVYGAGLYDFEHSYGVVGCEAKGTGDELEERYRIGEGRTVQVEAE